jgi:glycosyltransferase involved in cell wall biosynthesis
LRIAFLTSEFVTEPSFAGGLAQYLGRVTKGLADRGHHVEVFVAAETDEQLDYDGIIVHRVKPQNWKPLRMINFSLRLLRQNRFTETQNACSIAKGLNNAFCKRALQVVFDVVQAASWLGTGFFVSSKTSVPVVVRVSSYGPLLDAQCDKQLTIDRKLRSYIEQQTMHQADMVYTPSKFLADQIFQTTGLKPEVIRPPFYKSNGSSNFIRNEDLADWPKYLFYFGRLCRYKGIGLLAEAIEPLLQQIEDLRVALAGPIETDDTATKQLIALMNTYPDRVRYIGKLNQHELANAIENAHAIVLPSLMDNLPNTCIEAMSLGKVVIGPDGVSFDELIEDGRSGVLFKHSDVSSLRQAILRTWNMDQLHRQQISQAAKEQIAKMSPEIMLNDLENLYQMVISQRQN